MKKLLFLLFVGIQFIQAQHEAQLTKIGRNMPSHAIEDYFDAAAAPFYHGVASGDPLPNAIILWTRVTTNATQADVSWRIASDSQMTNVIGDGIYTTDASTDFTVKIDVTGLNPGTTYYYQFEHNGAQSVIGKTRTASVGDVANVRFGVVSCSNYQKSYFTAYEDLANRNDIDAVIHLGDYIYEYETGGYGYSEDVGRLHLPDHEIVSLEDYRLRYSYYRLDNMLKSVHQQHPFILIWDDHEFTNDSNKYGAENHQPDTEGDWETRKNNAYKAYFEWLPVRANSIEEYRLFRSLSYGNLLDLILLDTRIHGRDDVIEDSGRSANTGTVYDKFNKQAIKAILKQSDFRSIEGSKLAMEALLPYFIDTKSISEDDYSKLKSLFSEYAVKYTRSNGKSTLGSEKQELLNTLLINNTKDIGVKQTTPKANVKRKAYSSMLGELQYDWFLNELTSSTAKWRIIGNQVMMMPFSVPLNIMSTDDMWDGYSEERNSLIQYVQDQDISNVVVLTGDIHSMFAGEIKNNDNCEMVEFVTPSVNSDNVDFLPGWMSGIVDGLILGSNSHMKSVNMSAHGYFILDVKEDQVQADWYFSNDIYTPGSGSTFNRSYVKTDGVCELQESSSPSEPTLSYGEMATTPSLNNSTDDALVIFGVYPNPASDFGNIHYAITKPTSVQIDLYSLSGKYIKRLQESNKQSKGIYNLRFDVNGYNSGTYIIKIKDENSVYTRKLIIK